MADVDEAAALAWLCEHLPRFRHAVGNRTQLEKVVGNVRDGRKTAVWAYRQLGGPAEGRSSRGGDPFSVPLSLLNLNIDSTAVTGEYVCPHNRCARVGQPDDDGHEPQCHLDSSPMPMRFRSTS
ncbi:hypothetical protein [Saccharothrix stipae]